MPDSGTMTVEAWAAYCEACDWVSERTYASQTAALAKADRHKRWCPVRKRAEQLAILQAEPNWHGRHCWDGDDLVCGWPTMHDATEYSEGLMI